MTSKQVNFFCVDKDLNSIIDYLEDKEIMVFSQNSKLNENSYVSYENISFGNNYYLKFNNFKSSIFYEYYSSDMKSIDIRSSSLVELSLGGSYISNISCIHPSRIYFSTEFWNEKEILIKKDSSFVAEANKFLREFSKKFLKSLVINKYYKYFPEVVSGLEKGSIYMKEDDLMHLYYSKLN
jgi:hypothetical protein